MTILKLDKISLSNICVVFVTVVFFLFLFLVVLLPPVPSIESSDTKEGGVYYDSDIRKRSRLPSENRRKHDCYFFNCFEINTCQYGINDMIKVHIYQSDISYVDQQPISLEYRELINAIQESRYFEPRPQEACLFVPPFDTLNQRLIDVMLMSHMLSNLSWWNNGTNHIIFSMLPGQFPSYNITPDYNYGKAVLANSAFTANNFRMGFDISLPLFNSLTKIENPLPNDSSREYLLIVLVQFGANLNTLKLIKEQLVAMDTMTNNDKVLVLGSCDHCTKCSVSERCDLVKEEHYWSYPGILKKAKYCLILHGVRLGATPDLLDALMMGCVPVFILNYQLVLPFSEVLDWSLASVQVWIEEMTDLINILNKDAKELLTAKTKQVAFMYEKYFSSMASITMTTLDIFNGRVFPFNAFPYEYWNIHPDNKGLWNAQGSLRLPSPPLEEGFTAVILAYDRIEKLFKTIKSVGQANSLAKVLVVWNNSYKDPPPTSEWPHINKPVQVVRTTQNKLSNRFFPYDEIETAAILSLDDDITMMSSDEIEFGFKAWLEYPDRLVGYPGRVHRYDKTTGGWIYDSQWTNNVSVILTGAAFYHKYYHYYYTYSLPNVITNWIDKHFNCEDIVFNFMISNLTGLPPLKVTPRKRFKCLTCTNDGLFADSAHFRERNQCINLFAKHFGGIPLKAIKYRLDPVLYKVKSTTEQEFPNVGEL